MLALSCCTSPRFLQHKVTSFVFSYIRNTDCMFPWQATVHCGYIFRTPKHSNVQTHRHISENKSKQSNKKRNKKKENTAKQNKKSAFIIVNNDKWIYGCVIFSNVFYWGFILKFNVISPWCIGRRLIKLNKMSIIISHGTMLCYFILCFFCSFGVLVICFVFLFGKLNQTMKQNGFTASKQK